MRVSTDAVSCRIVVGESTDPVRERVALAGCVGGEEAERGELVRVGLRRRDRVLRARAKLEDGVGLARELGRRVVRESRR